MRREDPTAHVVLTGCSVDTNPDDYNPATAESGVDAVFSNAQKRGIAKYIEDLGRSRGTIAAYGGGQQDPSGPEAVGPEALRARFFLKVQDGCNHRCTYCVVWKARGESISPPLAQAVADARRAVALGYREIVLCGVDLGSFGRSHQTTLAELVSALLHEVGAEARIRLSSINANDISSELMELAAHPAFCPHWHIPVQSGSDAVLKAMHRGYRRKQFVSAITRLREIQPLTEVTTDVMVAFPGESEEDHRQTLSLIDEVAFLDCHVFRYSPRPGTPAS